MVKVDSGLFYALKSTQISCFTGAIQTDVPTKADRKTFEEMHPLFLQKKWNGRLVATT